MNFFKKALSSFGSFLFGLAVSPFILSSSLFFSYYDSFKILKGNKGGLGTVLAAALLTPLVGTVGFPFKVLLAHLPLILFKYPTVGFKYGFIHALSSIWTSFRHPFKEASKLSGSNIKNAVARQTEAKPVADATAEAETAALLAAKNEEERNRAAVVAMLQREEEEKNHVAAAAIHQEEINRAAALAIRRSEEEAMSRATIVAISAAEGQPTRGNNDSAFAAAIAESRREAQEAEEKRNIAAATAASFEEKPVEHVDPLIEAANNQLLKHIRELETEPSNLTHLVLSNKEITQFKKANRAPLPPEEQKKNSDILTNYNEMICSITQTQLASIKNPLTNVRQGTNEKNHYDCFEKEDLEEWIRQCSKNGQLAYNPSNRITLTATDIHPGIPKGLVDTLENLCVQIRRVVCDSALASASLSSMSLFPALAATMQQPTIEEVKRSEQFNKAVNHTGKISYDDCDSSEKLRRLTAALRLSRNKELNEELSNELGRIRQNQKLEEKARESESNTSSYQR